jgi:hypothetical protein
MLWYVNSTASAHSAVKLTSPFHPETITVSLGLRQLALMTVSGAIEDGQGRGAYTDKRQRRQNAARAIRWLRTRTTERHHEPNGALIPFSLPWCADVIGVDARLLARQGVSRVGGGGLDNWRLWRRQRNGNRVQPLPVLLKTCAGCNAPYTTKTARQVYCSQACSQTHMTRRPARPSVEQTSVSL